MKKTMNWTFPEKDLMDDKMSRLVVGRALPLALNLDILCAIYGNKIIKVFYAQNKIYLHEISMEEKIFWLIAVWGFQPFIEHWIELSLDDFNADKSQFPMRSFVFIQPKPFRKQHEQASVVNIWRGVQLQHSTNSRNTRMDSQV